MFWGKTVGRQSANRRPTGFLGSSSSQLPEFVEMKSFPFIGFDTIGTGSPFGNWYNENCFQK